MRLKDEAIEVEIALAKQPANEFDRGPENRD
jgi:hypothetical protein